MARVHVEFVGPMRRPWPEREREVEVADESTVGDLLADLGYHPTHARHLAVLINGEKARTSTVLRAGDAVVVTILVGGG